MAKNYKSAKYINARIETIIKNGYRPVTDLSYTKQNYAWILKPHGRKNSHLLMTYEEARKEMEKYVPNNPLTIEEYTQQLIGFQETFADRLTLHGHKRYVRSYMESVIDDAVNKYGEEYMNVSAISTDNLHKSFSKAREMLANQPDSKYNSENFYQYLLEILSEMR